MNKQEIFTKEALKRATFYGKIAMFHEKMKMKPCQVKRRKIL